MSFVKSELLIKLVIASLIISGFVSPAIAYDVSTFQWGDGTSGRLARGEELSYNGYIVKAIAFPAPKSGSSGTQLIRLTRLLGQYIRNGQFWQQQCLKR
jgi:hypothetical protein